VVPNDDTGRLASLRSSAENGDLDAMYRLGYWLSEHGDEAQGKEWLSRSGDGGYLKATDARGYVYERTGELKRAEHFYQSAAELGFDEAKSHLAYVLGLRGDDEGAERWYRAAADSGDVIAMVNLGCRIAYRGNLMEAKDLLLRATQEGHSSAMIELGRVWRDGGDVETARRWFEKALEVGVSGASEELTELDRKLISDPNLEALSFDTFGWAMTQNRENVRRWQSSEGFLDERFVEGPPFFSEWNIQKIRAQVTEILGDLNGGVVSVEEPAWKGEIPIRLPEGSSLVDISIADKRAKLVTLVVRSDIRSQIHYTATTYVLFAAAWWTLQIDIQEDEPIGNREAAVMRKILDESGVNAMTNTEFHPYDIQWDGLLPVESDPLSRVRSLSDRLLSSLVLSKEALELEPFEGL
jgi:tetratricopeptide (TPR) repeat protein